MEVSAGRNRSRKQPTQMEQAEPDKSLHSQGGGMIFFIYFSQHILFT